MNSKDKFELAKLILFGFWAPIEFWILQKIRSLLKKEIPKRFNINSQM